MYSQSHSRACRSLAVVGLTSGLLISLVIQSATAAETLLHAFAGGSDGALPLSGLTSDSVGNLYGTTQTGGANCDCGTVFKIAPGGSESVLYAFQAGKDGVWPWGGLAMDNSGNLYGTTEGGGGACGCGTIFELAPNGTETVLYAFRSGNDGEQPAGNLIRDQEGNLYGATRASGIYNGNCINYSCGTVFKLAADGTETVLYFFQGGSDGDLPADGVIADVSGNLYGTTVFGGSGGAGTVFKLASNGTETILYSFKGGNDGSAPEAGVIMDKSGNLYGTTATGGPFGGGTVYKLNPNGNETVLYAFRGGSDGSWPHSDLVRDKAGNLYGTTQYGGGTTKCHQHIRYLGCGSVFKLAPDGTKTELFAFKWKQGALPTHSLLLKNSTLYGTTMEGGAYNAGTVFSVSK